MSYGSGSHRNTNAWSRSNTSSSYSSDNQLYQGIGNVSYPISKRNYTDTYGNTYSQSSLSSSKSKTIRGYVTRLYDSWGLIDNDCHFSFSVCVKGIPKINDQVVADAVYSPNPQYKWKASKVQILNSDRDFSNIKSLMGSRSQNDFDARKRNRSPMHQEKSRDRRHDDGDKKRFKRDEKDDKSKETSERENYRDREKLKEVERSPLRRRSRTPAKRRLLRYAVKVPNDLLSLSSADIVTLKKRYPALYIPSDFFTSNFCWTETFPPHKPFTLDKPCAFHVMHKDCDSYVKNDAILDPPDLDYVFSVKVLLMSIPCLDEVYKKTLCLAEELHKEDEKNYTHLTRLIQFLVGTRGKGDPLAIGGPWSPSLDGENPDKNPSVLIKTAIRTCKALTGIDLSGCSQWYRFMEVYYHRSESVHKGKTIPARIETVVFFLPEVWNCVPTYLEWEDVLVNYKNLLEEKLQPKAIEDSANQTMHSDQAEESDKEEDLVVIDKCEDKLEPTPYTELDPKTMKVNELRQELEARSLSTKGIKSQLVARLTSALKKEAEEETETANNETESKPEPEVIAEEKEDGDELDKSEESLMLVDKVEDEKIEEGTDAVDNKVVEPIDRASLEKKYSLPDTPHVIVHPSRTAKSGKFDCAVLSLSSLLDYRTNENKEHSFELYLFAELFHEMLQRDFGFAIFKKFCELPEKVKEEKDDKDKKEDKESKETAKQNTPDKNDTVDAKDETEGNKNEQTKDSDENKKDESVEKEKGDGDAKVNGVKTSNSGKCDDAKKKERVKLVTKDPQLLLSFTFFDRTHCGYIFDKDLESIIFSLGLQLSRHQTKKLISKAAVRETVHYRKLTDKPEGEEEQQNLIPINEAELALGNRKFFPIFTESENADDSQKTPTSRRTRKGKNDSPVSKAPGLVNVGGSLVDVEKVTTSLKKSESARLEIEKQLFKYKKDYDTMKESLKKSSEKEKKINDDLQVCRDKLMSANKEKITLMNKSRTYYKLLMSIKDQVVAIEEKPEKVSRSSKSSDKSEDKTSKVKKESIEDETHDKSESANVDEKSETKDGQIKTESNEDSKTSSDEKAENDEKMQDDA